MGDYLFEGCNRLKRVVLRCGETKFSPHTFHSFWKRTSSSRQKLFWMAVRRPNYPRIYGTVSYAALQHNMLRVQKSCPHTRTV